ncbi:hypothetical protein AA18889_2585 [Acetobacter senegalensis DSM 18889]|nr:hypothetical protein AA18889_2585 [Acetobacter senegalensis DSM 18889]
MFNINQDFLGHSYLSNDVNNDVVNDGKLPVTIFNHKAASNGRLRLVLHTAAYWLMLTLRDAIPAPQPLASAEFTTLRNRLLKIAGRIMETATRVRIAFAAACPEAALFRSLAISMQAAGP